MNGTVKWVGPRGYGFIESECGQLVFAHASLMDGLSPGEEVFVDSVEPGLNGPKAVKISARNKAITTSDEVPAAQSQN